MDTQEIEKVVIVAEDNGVTEPLPLEDNIESKQQDSKLLYAINDKPALLVTLSLALQHTITCLPSCLTASIIIADIACVPYGHPARSALFSSTLFMSGLATIMQTAFGVRMPIFQGPADSFLIPLKIVSSDPLWKCPNGSLEYEDSGPGGSNSTLSQEFEDGMYWRLQTMSGSLMMASLLEIFLGAFGVLHIIMKYISPITVAVTISIIPIPLKGFVIHYASPQFPMALCTAILVVTFALYMRRLKIPIPSLRKGQPRAYFPLFQVLPVLLAMCIMWCIAGVLTAGGAFTDDKSSVEYYARTDAKVSIIENTPWFMPVYPGRFGLPKFSFAVFVGFLLASTASMVESVGDYYTAQRVSQLNYLPDHAVARGILAEGVASFISGSVGVCHATTSYSTNISMLALSKAVSRRIMYAAGIIYIGFSFLGKIGAAFITIPTPILGGTSMIVLGMIISIGLSNLARVDMTSSRNLLVFGVPFISAITIPPVMEQYPYLIQTGSYEMDAMIRMMLQNAIFLGGIMAFALDNTVPGDDESRGIRLRRSKVKDNGSASTPLSDDAETERIFSWSFYPRMVEKFPYLKYIPFLPHFRMFPLFKKKESPSENSVIK